MMTFPEVNRSTPFLPEFSFPDFHEPFGHDTLLTTPNEPNRRKTCKTSAVTVDERRRRRMKSNRESARRSRVRKQQYLEDLRNELDSLGIKKRELTEHFRAAAYKDGAIRRANEQLQSEAFVLRQRLWDLRQALLVQQYFVSCMAMQQ